MTPDEIAVRDRMARQMEMDPEAFEVELVQTHPGQYEAKLKFLGTDSAKQAKKAYDRFFRRPWYTRIFNPPIPFYVYLSAFCYTAYDRTWSCLFWLGLAWFNIPKKCSDCGRYHGS